MNADESVICRASAFIRVHLRFHFTLPAGGDRGWFEPLDIARIDRRRRGEVELLALLGQEMDAAERGVEA